MVTGTHEQQALKQELYNKIKECETEIANYKNKIDEINNLIIHTCVIQYGDHEFEREVESSIYGESYFICKNCSSLSSISFKRICF